jgi:multiple sugar transport system substrate-binding protein
MSSRPRAPSTEFANEVDYIKFVPPIPGVNDVMPEWNAAVSKAMLGKQDVAAAPGEAAGRANKILAANAKKYG